MATTARSNAGLAYNYNFDSMKRVKDALRTLHLVGKDVDTPLARWGLYQVSQTQKTYRNQGRGSIRWKPRSAKSVAAARTLKRPTSKKVLQSLAKFVETDTVTVGGLRTQAVWSTHPWAGLHQSGAKIKAHRVQAPTLGGVLRFAVGRKIIFARHVKIPTYRIPKREQFFMLAKDRLRAVQLIEQHVGKVTKRHIRTKGRKR